MKEKMKFYKESHSFGNLAIYLRPIAFRPYFTAGLAFSK